MPDPGRDPAHAPSGSNHSVGYDSHGLSSLRLQSPPAAGAAATGIAHFGEALRFNARRALEKLVSEARAVGIAPCDECPR